MSPEHRKSIGILFDWKVLKNARAFAPGPNLSTTGEDIKLAYEGLQGLGATRGKQVWKQLQDEQGVKTDNRKVEHGRRIEVLSKVLRDSTA